MTVIILRWSWLSGKPWTRHQMMWDDYVDRGLCACRARRRGVAVSGVQWKSAAFSGRVATKRDALFLQFPCGCAYGEPRGVTLSGEPVEKLENRILDGVPSRPNCSCDANGLRFSATTRNSVFQQNRPQAVIAA